MAVPLQPADPSSLGLDPAPLARMAAMIERHIEDGRYPGAQVALARHGRLAWSRSFGRATLVPASPAGDDTLFLLFSNTKVVTACAVWLLVEQGALRFADRIADHVPEFAANAKGEITVLQLLSHQAGFPNAQVPTAAWEDHALLRRTVCDFRLEWTPGTRVHYHSAAAHWTAAVLIEALTGQDFRTFIRDHVTRPIGLGDELFVGVPEAEQRRCVVIYEPEADGKGQIAIPDLAGPAVPAAGTPGGGGYGTARAMAAFYQMLAQGGELAGKRLLSRRMVEFVTRNHTGDRLDENFGMAMHRGIGPHVRGLTPTIRGLGTIAHPATFGHGGVGSSYCWADPDSGVSFAYLSNSRVPEPWHSERMDRISNLAHMTIVD